MFQRPHTLLIFPLLLLLAGPSAAQPRVPSGRAPARGSAKVAGAARKPPMKPQPTVAVMSADAEWVAAQMGRKVYVWQRSSGKLLGVAHSLDQFRGSVARGALVVVSAHAITVWRGKGLRRAVKLKIPKVLAMGRTSLSADGSVVSAIYAHDGGVGDPDTAGLWDARSGKRLAQLRLAGRLLGVALSPRGRFAALFGDHPQRGALLEVHALKRGKAKLLWRWQGARDRTTFSAAFDRKARQLALGTGQRVLLWDVSSRKLAAQAPNSALIQLFPPRLRPAIRKPPGAHGLAFSADGRQLVTLHGYRVVGAARWSVSPLKPMGWIKRPSAGGTMRQVAWDKTGQIWLITAGYAERVHVHRADGDRFKQQRILLAPK